MSTVEPDEQDLTRKQRREQARVRRKELEQQQAASDDDDPAFKCHGIAPFAVALPRA